MSCADSDPPSRLGRPVARLLPFLARLKQLAADHPNVTAYQNRLAASHNNLGILYSATGRKDSAEKAYLVGHKSSLKGAFAVDAGSTELLGPQLASVGLAGRTAPLNIAPLNMAPSPTYKNGYTGRICRTPMLIPPVMLMTK